MLLGSRADIILSMAKNKVLVSVEKAARLTNIPLDKATSNRILPQLNDALAYVNRLKKVETAGVLPTSQVTGLTNIAAQDQSKPCLTVQKALANASDSKDSFFKVPGVLKNES